MSTLIEKVATENEKAGEYLTFLLGGEEYAINILKVKEILEFDVITAVPNTPTWISGVLNLRGGVIPVVDLAVKFGMPPTPRTRLTCTIVTEVEHEDETSTIGVLAEEVCQVINLPSRDIEAPPSFGTRVRTDYLKGLGKIGKKFCLILDSNKVLYTDELLATVSTTEEVAEEAGLVESATSPPEMSGV